MKPKTRISGICEICGAYVPKRKYQHYHKEHPEYQFRRRKINGRMKYLCNLCAFRSADYRRMVDHFESSHKVSRALIKLNPTWRKIVPKPHWIRRLANWFLGD